MIWQPSKSVLRKKSTREFRLYWLTVIYHGPRSQRTRSQLAAWCGAKHAISCANGTDALQLALMALGARKGDAVFVPSFTFAATAEVVPCMGATPVLVDCDPRTYNMSPTSLKRSIVHAKTLGLRPSIVIPVDLFGLPADYDAIAQIADAEGLTIVSDSAQGWGSTIDGRMTGTFGRITTTSFFPAKPLGCHGDGGHCSLMTTSLLTCCKACACTVKAKRNTTTCA